MACTMLGCVIFSTSKFPRRSRGCFRNCEPRNAASSSCCAWIIVPMAPSKMTILSFRRFFRAAIRDSLRSNDNLPCVKGPWNWADRAYAVYAIQKRAKNLSLVFYRRDLNDRMDILTSRPHTSSPAARGSRGNVPDQARISGFGQTAGAPLEEVEDFLIPLKRRDQVGAGNSQMASASRPVQQFAREGETMIARGGSRGFELLQQRLRNYDAGHLVMEAQGLFITAQRPQTYQDGNRRFSAHAF